tara:strand:+ start:297 stop:746 length:450 start_codon:yes stop_codon:yes gene_type:complete
MSITAEKINADKIHRQLRNEPQIIGLRLHNRGLWGQSNLRMELLSICTLQRDFSFFREHFEYVTVLKQPAIEFDDKHVSYCAEVIDELAITTLAHRNAKQEVIFAFIFAFFSDNKSLAEQISDGCSYDVATFEQITVALDKFEIEWSVS